MFCYILKRITRRLEQEASDQKMDGSTNVDRLAIDSPALNTGQCRNIIWIANSRLTVSQNLCARRAFPQPRAFPYRLNAVEL
ncbi:hypothetical protein M407DRAFT_244419 [Tulasnella calospora MUT 4182]|uniref:Uncharacterized protein n=1 Tax=Tulasnella calospora MUT 4182 TaxID=1051891 RepID=A0A0C3QEV5_9AGAM|nr:hypothetical protein M407DRAFT_244419 [Tulasnella calospora MUT 4182]